jgi:hypothetical protein
VFLSPNTWPANRMSMTQTNTSRTHQYAMSLSVMNGFWHLQSSAALVTACSCLYSLQILFLVLLRSLDVKTAKKNKSCEIVSAASKTRAGCDERCPTHMPGVSKCSGTSAVHLHMRYTPTTCSVRL